MKHSIYLVFIVLLISCNSENAGDCLQTAGTIIEQEVAVANFDKILVNRDVALILKEGDTQKVVIETGENLIDEVTAIVTEGMLILTDNNTCNYVRDYGTTKVYVTSPNITEIRSSTQYDIKSDGVLTYPDLTLLSEDYSTPDAFVVGDFYLQINNTRFRVVFNNLSSCFVSGETTHLNIMLASGNGRFEGGNLSAQNVIVFHRGTNDIIVNPQESLKGEIRSIGNVISKHNPVVVDVDELYKGKLIFE